MKIENGRKHKVYLKTLNWEELEGGRRKDTDYLTKMTSEFLEYLISSQRSWELVGAEEVDFHHIQQACKLSRECDLPWETKPVISLRLL